jgi:hypothetical protein
MLQFADFYAAVTYFEGNGNLAREMSIDRQPSCVRFLADRNPEVFIAVSPTSTGGIRVETNCPTESSAEPSAHLIGNHSDYHVSSIKDIWELVRTFFAPPEAITKFTWGDCVRIRDDAPAEMNPGALGVVVWVSSQDDRPTDPVIYKIEFGDGLPDADVPESVLLAD